MSRPHGGYHIVNVVRADKLRKLWPLSDAAKANIANINLVLVLLLVLAGGVYVILNSYNAYLCCLLMALLLNAICHGITMDPK